MQKAIREEVAGILKQATALFRKKDFDALSLLSNTIIHTASIYQDEISISTATAIYALAKVGQRCSSQQMLHEKLAKLLDAVKLSVNAKISVNADTANFATNSTANAIVNTNAADDVNNTALNSNNDSMVILALKNLLAEIKKIDEKLNLYADEVLTKARLKKATAMHEHGVSLGKTAELLNVSRWDLANYSGKTISKDELPFTAKEKLLLTRRIFK